nr:glycosyltransferase family 4 protein [uncultured Desulfobacter sp.]
MKILILSFYFPPDLCAGSFRTKALVNALIEQVPEHAQLNVITTLPNRYHSFTHAAPEKEDTARIVIHRVKTPLHKSGIIDQAKAFGAYAIQVLKLVKDENYDLVYGTSSRLMTAALSAMIAHWKNLPLFLDIRDIFVDTIKDVMPGKLLWFAKPVFKFIEGWTVRRANQVNLVSKGFESYFKASYPKQVYSFFTNGIDPEFVIDQMPQGRLGDTNTLTVVYAGNMGEGQGLHTIIPELANRLTGKVAFRLIGDGGRRELLEMRIKETRCTNVELLPPISRDKLLNEYKNADILFLHLNKYDAFLKVLPSKLFEYGALGKPVWAGVAGYAAQFISEEISNSAVFGPCDVNDAVDKLNQLVFHTQPRKEFIEKYLRTKIMQCMAREILIVLKNDKR